jgi:hypothetical protein
MDIQEIAEKLRLKGYSIIGDRSLESCSERELIGEALRIGIIKPIKDLRWEKTECLGAGRKNGNP